MAPDKNRQRTKETKVALATLLYDSSYIEGVRVLGRSVLAQCKKREVWWSALVALTTNEVRSEAKRLLHGEKWQLIDIATVSAPRNVKVSAPRLQYVYSKLAIFNLTAFDRVVYIDADVVVLGDLSPLAQCPADFCAVMRQFELFNSGVLSIRPNEKIAHEMYKATRTTFSYTGGDQGFLNEFFTRFEYCPYFDDSVKSEAKISLSCRRLPAHYNGDWPLIFVNGNKVQRIALSHMTLGAVKPWTWPVAPFLPSVAVWQSYALPRQNTYLDSAQPILPGCLFLFLIHRLAPPISSPSVRCIFIFFIMVLSGKIALLAAPSDFNASTILVKYIWARVFFWFSCLYLTAFFLYRRKSLQFPKYSHHFWIYTLAFLVLELAILCGPRLFLFNEPTSGSLVDLLTLVLPLIYAFLVLNTAAAVLLIPPPESLLSSNPQVEEKYHQDSSSSSPSSYFSTRRRRILPTTTKESRRHLAHSPAETDVAASSEEDYETIGTLLDSTAASSSQRLLRSASSASLRSPVLHLVGGSTGGQKASSSISRFPS